MLPPGFSLHCYLTIVFAFVNDNKYVAVLSSVVIHLVTTSCLYHHHQFDSTPAAAPMSFTGVVQCLQRAD